MRHYLYVLFIILLSLVSCETDLPEGTWSKEPPTTVTYQLSVNKTTIIVGAEGASETFGITSDDSWTASASESWIKVSDTTGAGDKTVTVTVEANTDKEARSGTITVKGKSSGSKSISVSQSGKEYSLSVDKTEISVGAAESSETIMITSNDSWTASLDANWATLSASSGSGDMTLIVAISLNSTTSERTGKISIKGSNSPKENTITITQLGTSSSYTNVHDYVDLSLPSGLLWATCNVGASTPEDYGDYFAWGATKPQSVYYWETTPYQTQDVTNYLATRFTKYLGSTTSSFKDSSAKDSDAMKTVLDPEDDAAHVNWGGNWRMPTKEEQDELSDTSNCTWTWTTQNGVNGYKVTSKKNGNSLFLPIAGYRYNDPDLHRAGSDGYYWSSSLYTGEPGSASCLNCDLGKVYWSVQQRCRGLSVRPVCTSSE